MVGVWKEKALKMERQKSNFVFLIIHHQKISKYQGIHMQIQIFLLNIIQIWKFGPPKKEKTKNLNERRILN